MWSLLDYSTMSNAAQFARTDISSSNNDKTFEPNDFFAMDTVTSLGSWNDFFSSDLDVGELGFMENGTHGFEP
jgi:hypothetical protein